MADNFPFMYYADASALNDTGNATSGNPKKFFQSLQSSLNYREGQALLLRPGRYYDVAAVGAGMGGIFRSHVTLKPWDNGESGKPTLDGRNWIHPITDAAQSRFTSEGPAGGGGHVWSIIIGTEQPVVRVFAGARNTGVLLSQRTIGEGLGTTPDSVGDVYAQIAAALSRKDAWHGAGSALGYKLYVWTPSANDEPTMYYGGFAVLQYGLGTTGFDVGILISSNAANHAQDVLVQDIDVIGAVGSPVRISGNASDNRVVSNIRVERVNGYLLYNSGVVTRQGISAANIASGISVVRDVRVRSCVMDNTLFPAEEELTRAYGHFTGADMFVIFDNVDNVVYEDCIAINPRHSGFAMGNYSASSTWTKRSGFRRCKSIATAGNSYARGFAISMTDDTCFVDQHVNDGMNVASQAIGSVSITNVVYKNTRPPIRMADLPDPANNHLSIYSNIVDRGTAGIGNERYIYSYPINVRVLNNSFGPLPSPGSPVIKIAAYGGIPAGSTGLSPAQFPSGTVTLSNNLMLDTNPARASRPILSTEVDANVTLGDIVFDSNAVYKGGEVPTVMYRGTTYPLNSAPGFVSNLTADPRVDKNLRPMRGSPLIASGKVLGRLMRDTTGRERPARSTIGAFEDFTVYNRKPRP